MFRHHEHHKQRDPRHGAAPSGNCPRPVLRLPESKQVARGREEWSGGGERRKGVRVRGGGRRGGGGDGEGGAK
jgi:hypothetical protein